MTVLKLVPLFLLVMLLVPWTGGCDQCQKDLQVARIMNRDLENQLTDKKAEIRELQERIRSLEARINDFNAMMSGKGDQIAMLQNEIAALKAALAQKDQDLRDLIEKLGSVPVAAAGQIPEGTKAALRALQQTYPEFFVFDEASQQLRYASDITFDSGEDIVKPKAQEVLTKLAAILNQPEAQPIRIVIVGHTDNARVVKPETVRKHGNNQGLSEHRAEAVAKVLQAGGVDAARMATSGMGESQPIASNSTNEGKAKNRRVEIFLRMAN